MGNIKNLIPNSARTPEELRAMAIRGGKKSGEVRRHNKTFKEALRWYLDMPITASNDVEQELLHKFPDLTYREYLVIASIEAATKDKDVRAMVFARDTTGELPTQMVNVGQEEQFVINIKTIE